VGYFFGKKINQELNAPVGIINASWGGTPAEVWLPREKVEADAGLKAAAVKQTDDRLGVHPSRRGLQLHDKPIIPFRIAGALCIRANQTRRALHL
jgi:sialate O-acetylesterase